jgi:hypothetical protein
MVADAAIWSKKLFTQRISSIRKVILTRGYGKALFTGGLIYTGISR